MFSRNSPPLCNKIFRFFNETLSVSIFRNDINNKKIVIILTFLGVSVLGAIILSFVNVHYDFLELRNFYRGYMGRRLLIQEGRLTYRKHPEPEPETQKTKVSRGTAACQPTGNRLSYFTERTLPTLLFSPPFQLTKITVMGIFYQKNKMSLSLSSTRPILKFPTERRTDLTDLKTEDSSFQCLRKSQVSIIVKI